MISAVIFDMDGLLLDSEVYWERARRDYAASMGCEWREQDELESKGKNSPEWSELIRERCGTKLEPRQVITEVSERMRHLYDERLPLLPGAVRAVREVASRYPVGIASSSPPDLIEFAMQEAGLRACFSAIVSADTAGRGKPSPDVFLVTGEKLGFQPERIAVFEDSSAGITAAVNAGMQVIAVPNPHYPPTKEALSKADIVLDSLTEFSMSMLDEL